MAVDEMKKKYPNLTNLDEGSIRAWRKNADLQPEDAKESTKNKQIRRHKGKYPEAEDKLIEKIRQVRNEKKPVSRANIIAWAKDLVGDPNFTASNGWFTRFKKRAKLSLRVPTHVIQQLRENYQKEIILYFNTIRNK